MSDFLEVKILHRLASGPARTGQLARLFGLSTPFVRRRIQKLEKQGKVVRHPRYTYDNDISWTLPDSAKA